MKLGKIIAAIRSEAEFEKALKSPTAQIFDLSPDILSVKSRVAKAHDVGKQLFVHIDLAKGVGKDESGVRFLQLAGVDGIITTKASLIKLARETGLYTVQRFFTVDSHSIDTTVDSVKSARPNVMEIMPGTVPKVIVRLRSLVDTPVISGGFIETKEEVEASLEAGAIAVSTGKATLWYEQ